MEFDDDDYHKSVSLITGFIFRYVCEFTIRITPKNKNGQSHDKGSILQNLTTSCYTVYLHNTGPSEPRPDCKGCKHRNQAFNFIRPWITTCFPSKFLPFYRSCYPIAKHTSIRLTYTHLQFSEVFDNKQMTVTF